MYLQTEESPNSSSTKHESVHGPRKSEDKNFWPPERLDTSPVHWGWVFASEDEDLDGLTDL
jgi:hypothetical protein